MKDLKRIFIIGHPAVGKAYFAKSLADRLGYQFIDADIGLEHRIGLHIKEILGKIGLEHYERSQEAIFDSLSKRSGVVVGLDCHIGKTPKIKEYLKDACVVFLKTTLETQIRRFGSRESLISDQQYEDLFKTLHDDRDDYYHKISNVILSADDGDVDRHVAVILAYLKQKEFNLIKPIGLTDKELVFFKYKTDIPVCISEQQAICLKHLSKGHSAKKIAREMDISYRTVEVYIAQLKEKLECDSSKNLIDLYLSKY